LRLALLGATGRLGGHVLRAAIARGHHVTVLVRDPARLPASPPPTRVVVGDVADPAAVADALRGAEAVISCLGTRRGQEPPELLAAAMANVVAAARPLAQGVVGAAMARPTHVVVVAAAGLLDAPAGGLRRDRPGYPAAFVRGSAAHLAAFEVLAAGPLPWTLVCPPELVDGAPDQPLQWARDVLPNGPLRVSMPALAAWMLAEAEAPAHPGQRVGLINQPESP